MTGGGFDHSGHDDQANRPPGAAGDPEQTVWGGAASPAQPSWGAPWEPPAVDYPHTDYPPPSYPAGPPGYQPPGYGGAPYQPPPPPPPMQYGVPAAGYQPYPYGGGYYAAPGTNGFAIASLVSSIVGLCCLLGGIVGVVLGIVALNQIKQTHQDGHGLAVAGIVIGGIGIAVTVVYLFVSVGMHSR
jgi:hypothetical protein